MRLARGPRPLRVERVAGWLHDSAAGLVVMATAVGAGAGAGAVAFRFLILGFTRIFTATDDYSSAAGTANPHVPWLGLWFVVLAPAVGGLIYGPMVRRFAPEARGHGVPEVMLAVADSGGRIRPQVAVVKALASALCIGSGGSVGREGPIVQVGSALGSTFGQIVRVPENRMRILVACGAAGGISATFNAPIAGVFFALELILGDFAVDSFGVVVLASVTAAVVGQAVFGSQPFLTLPAFHLQSAPEFAVYAMLGIVAGAAGVGFVRVLYGLEDIVDRLWRGWPEWARPAVGGLALGLLLLGMPELYGVGYPVLARAIEGHFVPVMLIGLLAGKMLATSLTIAIGGSGGVFAPSLFMGAMLGTAIGDLAHLLLGAGAAPAGAYGIVGMGALFAGAARAPITAVIIIFELTGDYTIILPLMTAVVLAAGISNVLTRDTVYTLKLRRRGIDIQRGRNASLMEVIPVRDAMQPMPPPLAIDTGLEDLTARLLDEHREALPVVDADGVYRGVVSSHQVEEAMRSNSLDVTAEMLLTDVGPVDAAASLQEALGTLVQRSRGGIPVTDGDVLAGWLTHRDVLHAYHQRLRATAGAAAAGGAGRPDTVTTVGGRLMYMPPRDLAGFRIVDVTLSAGEPAGHPLSAIAWPESTLVIAIRRDGDTFVPNGATVLQRGDRLTVLVPAGSADGLLDALTVRARHRDGEGETNHVPGVRPPG